MTLHSDNVRGMMLAGACGDALGAPVEFQSRRSILDQYDGPIRDFDVAYGRLGAITDDTQMLLWTAEGLIRSFNGDGSEPIEAYVRRSYLRWFATQRRELPDEVSPADGWLWSVDELHSTRAPGTTCLGGLGVSIRTGRMGTIDEPVHHGDGCGAIMRIAPVSVVATGDRAFELGVKCGALSHGERGAVLAAGFFAAFLSDVGQGVEMHKSIESNLKRMRAVAGSERICSLVERAVRLADKRPGSIDALESLGGAWRGDEALALTLYAVLSFPDNLEEAIVFAVTHSGDSDSTGSLAGNVMGLRFPDRIPARWLEQLEVRDQIAQLADDLSAHAGGQHDPERYPGR